MHLPAVCKARPAWQPPVYYALFFFAASVGGWIWEVGVFWIDHWGRYSLWELIAGYRGFLHGPWAPIYGVGAVLMVLLSVKAGRRPGRFFAVCMAVCGVLEYVTSWALEQLFHARWWDYTGYFLNINGRICAMSLLVFAAAGLLVAYLLAPLFWRGMDRLPRRAVRLAAAVLAALFAADLILSIAAPNLGLGVTRA